MSVSIYREDGSLNPVANGWMRTWVCTKAWWSAHKAEVPDGTLVYITDDTREKELEILDVVYPVGTVYMNASDTRNPALIFGSVTEPFGEWRSLDGKFLLGASKDAEDNWDIGAVGGSFTKTLTEANLPLHQHYFTPSGGVSITVNPSFTGTRGQTGAITGDNYAEFTSMGSWGGSVFPYSGRATITRGSSREQGISHGNGNNLDTFNINFTHEHFFTPAGTISGGAYAFSGVRSLTENVGSNTAFDVTPPYVKVAIWKRTA